MNSLMYILLVLGVLILLILPFSKCNLKFYILLVAAFFSFFGFLYDPFAQLDAVKVGSGVDLVRYFNELENFRFFGADYEGYLSQPLSRYYLLFFSQFDSNSFLPGVTAFFIYGINLFLIYKIGQMFHYSNSIISVGLIVFIAFNDYFSTINLIRYPMAMTLFFLILYWDMFCSIKITRLLYIIPILFHPGMVLMVLVRFVSLGNVKQSIILGLGACILFFFGFDSFFDSLISATDSLLGTSIFAAGLQAKTLSYTTDIVYQVPLLTLFVSVFITLILPFFTITLIGINKKWIVNNKQFIIMGCFLVGLSMFFLVTNISTGNMTTRISLAVSFLVGVLIMPIESALVKIRNGNFTYKVFNLLLIGYIIILLAVRWGKQYVSWIAPGL